MALSTVTTVKTISDFTFISEIFTTTTSYIWTSAPATAGETVTLGPTLSYAVPTAKYTPTFIPFETCTITEYIVFLQNPQGNKWTTIILDTSPTEVIDPNSAYPPGEKIFVVPYSCSGWSCWSAGAKAGLIIGAVFGPLFFLLLLCCFNRWRRGKIWVSRGAHGVNEYERWQNSHPGWGYYPPQVNLHTGYGLRPHVSSPRAEATLRGGTNPVDETAPRGGAKEAEKAKEKEKKANNKRQKIRP